MHTFGQRARTKVRYGQASAIGPSALNYRRFQRFIVPATTGYRGGFQGRQEAVRIRIMGNVALTLGEAVLGSGGRWLC